MRAVGGIVVVLAGCVAAAYQPARARLPVGLPDDAFERARDCVAAAFPALVEVDRARFRIRTDWCPRIVRGVVAQARATVWMDGDDLCAVVEARYLNSAGFGPPSWTGVHSQPHWERDLLERISAAFRAG